MKPLLIQRAARRDLREAASWYRERNIEVGDRFVAEVERTLELIERFPATGARIPLLGGPVRRLPVNDFPYHVVFEEFPDRAEVLADSDPLSIDLLELGVSRTPVAASMRRSVQPTCPGAMTCCFFASLKDVGHAGGVTTVSAAAATY